MWSNTMTVNYDPMKVINEFRRKRQILLTMTGHKGEAIAAVNMGNDYRRHVDTGTSSNAKQFSPNPVPLNAETIIIEAPMEYDIYLEKRYGIMVRVKDMIKPYIKDYMEFIFGK